MNLQQSKNKYVEDALQLLVELDNSILILEKNPESKEHLEQVFRIMYTLKGTSSIYGFEKIMEIAHELENIFNLVREDKIISDENLLNFTLISVDHIRNLLHYENFPELANIEKHNFLLTKIDRILKMYDTSTVEENVKTHFNRNELKPRTWQILITPNDSLLFQNINLLNTFSDLYKLGEYKIDIPDLEDDMVHWAIYLVTDKNYGDIEDALVSVMEYCKIQLIADFDIFNKEEITKRDKEIEKLSNASHI